MPSVGVGHGGRGRLGTHAQCGVQRQVPVGADHQASSLTGVTGLIGGVSP